jgi:probable F420-dependent oxidoreductase
MKLGIFPPLNAPLATADYMVTVAKAAEDSGFHSIWTPEHVVLFDEYDSQYPYSADGRIGVPGTAGVMEPFLVLTFLAAATKTIRLGTGIVLVPQRNPVYTAKAAATLDFLSGGRFDFGIGIGWLKEEFEALQVPWPDRAGRTRDYVAAMKSLWTEEVSQFSGKHYSFPPTRQYPKPIQQPHPPLYFGGESDAALRRAATIGNGWLGFGHDPASAAERLQVLDRELTAAGRSRKDVRVIVCPFRNRVDEAALEQFGALGVDEIVISAGARTAEDMARRLGEISDQLMKTAERL